MFALFFSLLHKCVYNYSRSIHIVGNPSSAYRNNMEFNDHNNSTWPKVSPIGRAEYQASPLTSFVKVKKTLDVHDFFSAPMFEYDETKILY